MPVRAPFNFVRIPRAVWYPEWGEQVSHDIPFKDGYCGKLTLEIEAKTELLVGGERKAASKNGAGEVWPVRLPDGRYTIPPSTLQGMVRSILEKACFGKLGPHVENRRFAVRDIGRSETGKIIYGRRMNELQMNDRGGQQIIVPRTRTGWLQKESDGKVTLTPCEYARIDFSDIVLLANAGHNLRQRLGNRNNANDRYQAFLNAVAGQSLKVRVDVDDTPDEARHGIQYTFCRPGNRRTGSLVLTGNASGNKHYEFVFLDPVDDQSVSKPIYVTNDVFRDFTLIHQPPKGSGQKENPNWEYWRGDFEAGKRVPIFYLEQVSTNNDPKTGTVAAMGTAFMFKLAHINDTHQMLTNSHSEHVSQFHGTVDGEAGRLDLPSLIFGAVGGKEGDYFRNSLKRRAAFGWAKHIGESESVELAHGANPAILLSPKPSYYPIYVRQGPSNRLADGGDGTYASYTPVDGKLRPELSGAKVFPTQQDSQSYLRQMPNVPNGTERVQTKLNTLPIGTKFACDLHIHNLRKFELGALLWALTLGDDRALNGRVGAYRHNIGMGKPLGLGSVSIVIKPEPRLLTSNDPEEMGENGQFDPKDIASAFVERMNEYYQGFGDSVQQHDWIGSIQVGAIKEAALPIGIRNPQGPYMSLNPGEGQNEFQTNKEHGWYLEPLAAADFFGMELSMQNPTKSDEDQEEKPVQPNFQIGQRVQVIANQMIGTVLRLKANGVRVQLDGGNFNFSFNEVESADEQ